MLWAPCSTLDGPAKKKPYMLKSLAFRTQPRNNKDVHIREIAVELARPENNITLTASRKNTLAAKEATEYLDKLGSHNFPFVYIHRRYAPNDAVLRVKRLTDQLHIVH